jgi:hypothetical protein
VAVRRRTWGGLVAAVLVVLAAVTLIWFQPQKLFYDRRVDEAPPAVAQEPAAPSAGGSTAATAAGPVDLAVGTFISREHGTNGTARVLQLPDGRVVVRFEDFATSNGPQLVVWLSGNAAAGDDAAFPDDHLDLGALKGNVGDQNYAVPSGIDVTAYRSVVVWCDRFDVPFGAADLRPTA